MLPWDLSALGFHFYNAPLRPGFHPHPPGTAFTFKMLPWDFDPHCFHFYNAPLGPRIAFTFYPLGLWNAKGFHFSRGGVPVTARVSGLSARELWPRQPTGNVTNHVTRRRIKSQFLLNVWRDYNEAAQRGAVRTMLKVKKTVESTLPGQVLKQFRMLKEKLPFEDVKVYNDTTYKTKVQKNEAKWIGVKLILNRGDSTMSYLRL